MAIKARIQLRGCASHTGRGRKAERGKPFYTTNAADIAYYRAQGVYSVSVLESTEDKPVVKPSVKPSARRAPAPAPTPAPEPEPDEPDEGEDEGDDEGEDDGAVDGSYTKSDLMATKKADLAQLAQDDFDLDLDPDNMTKAQMVAAILKAQIDAFADEED